MTRQEKWVALVLVLFVAGRLGSVAAQLVIARHYGVPHIPLFVWRLFQSAALIGGALVNAGAALWLWMEARAAKRTGWIWLGLGLCCGLLGVALFYLVQLHERSAGKADEIHPSRLRAPALDEYQPATE